MNYHTHATFINTQIVSRPSHLSHLGRPHTVPLPSTPYLTPQTKPPDTHIMLSCAFYLPINKMYLVCYAHWCWRKNTIQNTDNLGSAVGLLTGDSDRYVWWETRAKSDAGTLRSYRSLWRQGHHRRETTLWTISPNQHLLLSLHRSVLCVLLVCCIDYAE